MTAVLLSAHVLAAIILIGPTTGALLAFSPMARRVLASGSPIDRSWLELAGRISRRAGIASALVPVLGVATGAAMDVLGDIWVSASLALTALAALLLTTVLLPEQGAVLADLRRGSARPGGRLLRLQIGSAVFASVWVAVVVLMIVRPGSTTGV